MELINIMNTSVKKERVIYFDILNIFACFAVLALHHNGIVHTFNINTDTWKQALAFEVAFYWAVPIFFMLSGATLLNYRDKYSTMEFFSRRVWRAVFPFILWSIILLFHAYVVGNFPYKNLQDVINAIINTSLPYGNVYWFFIPLIALYFITPVLSLLKDNQIILWYVIIFIFITHSCLPLIFKWLGLKYNFALSFPMMGFTLFILLGWVISNWNLSKWQRYIIYLLGIGSALIRYFGTLHYSLVNGKLDKFLFGYMHFHSVLLALAVFVFVKYTFIDSKHSKLISLLSSCSLGVYLIHKLVMHYELKLLNLTEDNIYWRFLGAFLTYIVCLCIVLLIKKLPYIRNVFP